MLAILETHPALVGFSFNSTVGQNARRAAANELLLNHIELLFTGFLGRLLRFCHFFFIGLGRFVTRLGDFLSGIIKGGDVFGGGDGGDLFRCAHLFGR